MEDDQLDDSILLTRFRSPCFTKKEVLLLVDLIEKYKDGLLNKSMSTAACRIKDITWIKIGKEYNKRNPNHERSTESLKIKWDNLKKVVRKLTNNLLEIDNDNLDEVNSRILSLVYEAEYKGKNTNDPTLKSFNEQADDATQNDAVMISREIDLDDSMDCFDEDYDNVNILRSHRSPGFRKGETFTILSLVEKHLDVIMDKCTKSDTNEAKEKIWMSICNTFNAQATTQRKAYQIKRKWENLKSLSRKYRSNIRHDAQKKNEIMDKVCEMLDMYENKDNSAPAEGNCVVNDVDLNEMNNASYGVSFEESVSEDDCCDENDDYYEKTMRSKFRGPGFKNEEIKLLLSLVEKHLDIIMDKCKKIQTNEAKNRIWLLISKVFNKRTQSEFKRSAYQLKRKWDHLRTFLKQYENKVKHDPRERDEIFEKVSDMLSSFENKHEEFESNDVNENNELNGTSTTTNGNIFDDNDFEENSSKNISRKIYYRKFTPRECALLMHCVKQEKNAMRPNSSSDFAWMRITKSYNKQTPVKRSTNILRNKYRTLRIMSRSIPNKRSVAKLHRNRRICGYDDTQRIIKKEPSERDDSDADDICAEDLVSVNANHNYFSKNATDDAQDPLTTVLNTDSGIDETAHCEDKDVIRLKIELLNYKKETAKLERKRIENAIESDALEASLRLRAARLEAVAAAMRLPELHPALIYTHEESRAQEYILQYQDT